jgi:hypothetical protein
VTDKLYLGSDPFQTLTTFITTSDPTTAATTQAGVGAALPECSVTLTTTGGDVLVVFSGTFTHTQAAIINIALYLDGVRREERTATLVTANTYITMMLEDLIPAAAIPAGSHSLTMYYYSNAGATLTAVGAARGMMVVELT